MAKTQKDFENLLEIGKDYGDFTVEAIEPINEIAGYGYVLRHLNSGARLLWLANADTNRSFAISFKTPPTSDTGVFHIIEHSVLCGSTKYPVKEPFVNLLKSSMQTFLNALTFSDKTMYPVASTNVSDLENLMDVYLDAVFHPQMYRKPSIFSQEGWHLELENVDAPLSYNGVVYNEMKGSLSDPESFLYVHMKRALFPDTAYRFESGGRPDAIVDLTYEQFLDNHNRHYQLDNSYSILYGDLDIERELAFLGKRFAAAQKDLLEKERKQPSAAPNLLTTQNPVTPTPIKVPMATDPKNATVGLGYVVGQAHERKKLLATSILIDALFGSNEAPLKKAILDADLGCDVSAELIDDQGQPFILIQLQGAKPGVAEAFQECIEKEARRIIDEGIDPARLEAALAQTEFNFREQDYGHYPTGVALSMSCMGTWLYDDECIFSNLHFEDELADLSSSMGLGVFENYLDELIAHSKHKARVELEPITTPASQEEVARLEKMKDSLSVETCQELIAQSQELHAEQSAPDDQEALGKLPWLNIKDIGSAPSLPQGKAYENAPFPCHFYDIDTHRISYANTYFDLTRFAYEELPYLGILALLLGKLDTRYHSAAELDALLNTHLGDLSFEISPFSQYEHPLTTIKPRFTISASALSEKTSFLAQLPYEVALETLFEDTEKIRAILQQQKLSFEQLMVESGHAIARSRTRSYYSVAEAFVQQVEGVDFYLFLSRLLEKWDKAKKATCEILYNIQSRLFKADSVSLSFAGSHDDLDAFWTEGGTLGLTDDGFQTKSQLVVPKPHPLNEAIRVPADVCFCARSSAGKLLEDALHYSGAWLVASRAITYEYLWNEVRVLGGAYGAGFGVTADTLMSFYSYRDPAIDPTLARFARTGDWLAGFNPSKRDMEGYLVATIALLDNPKKPREIVATQDSLRMRGYPENWEAVLRDEVLHTTCDDLRSLAPTLQDSEEDYGICVVGGAEFFERSQAKLHLVDTELGKDLA